jgi:hypothetical protein
MELLPLETCRVGLLYCFLDPMESYETSKMGLEKHDIWECLRIGGPRNFTFNWKIESFGIQLF